MAATLEDQHESIDEALGLLNRAAGLDLKPSDIAKEIGLLVDRGLASATPPPLSEAEEAFLNQHGDAPTDRHGAVLAGIGQRLAERVAHAEAMSVTEAAELIGVNASRIRHRINEGSVYAFPSRGRGSARRVPAWQFIDNTPLPHLARVLGALPDGLAPLDVADFFTKTLIESPHSGEQFVVASWLATGGDVNLALERAENYGQMA